MADQTTNTSLQNPNDILSAVQSLAGSISAPGTPNIPSLNFTMPSATDLPAQYQQFLQDAANDPSIVNYYQQLLDFAKGDTQTAIDQLKNDYKTAVQQTTDTLGNSLKQLGLTFTGESNSMLDQLNKRGIALTQEGAKGPLTYAGGGQSATELGQLNQSQQLRQEAEQRSAQQSIQNAGIAQTKGITSANEALQNQAISLGQSKQQDITNRANLALSAKQQADVLAAQKAVYGQTSGGGSSGPKTKSQIAADYTAGGGTGDVPVGFEGYGSASA